MDTQNLHPVVVYSGNPLEAEMVSDMLQDYGIQTFTKNSLMGYIAPWHITSGGVDPVEVEVPISDRDKALEIVTAFNHMH